MKIIFIIFILFTIFGFIYRNRQTIQTSDPPAHHTARGFRNIGVDPEHGLAQVLRWKLGFGPEEPVPIPPEEVPPYVPDTVTPDLEKIRHPEPGTIQLSWIGHATFLIQVDGMNILTDPIFSERGSPVSFAGPKRAVPPGIRFEDLPSIDAVILSHNHYDHMDAPTLKRLGNSVKYFVALGNGVILENWGITNVIELDWWDSARFNAIRFHSVPTRHFSSRTPFDFDQALWTGWILETGAGKIFFAGDTGYSQHFREISDRFGPVRLALLPIGAYRPRWFMRPMHMDPADAVQAHLDLRSEQSVAMHWGTIKLTDEPLGEPPLYLQKVMGEKGIDNFRVMRFGETVTF